MQFIGLRACRDMGGCGWGGGEGGGRLTVGPREEGGRERGGRRPFLLPELTVFVTMAERREV